jgi:hypothetical protein
MKFKMRILHFSPVGNTMEIATAIGRDQKASSDKIPPAYPCENEKLLFLGVEVKGSTPDKAVVKFCNDMSAARAKNVAIYATGSSFEAVDEIKKILASKGCEIVGEPYLCKVKGGLFKQGTVQPDDIRGAVTWAAKIVDSLA